MSSILAAALAGAAGGAVGAGVAWVLARVLPRKPNWLAVMPIAFAMLAVALLRNLEPTAGEQALAALDESATIQALRAHYPDDYAKLASQVRAAAATAGPQDAQALVGGVLGEVMTRQRPKANPENARALYAVTRMEGQALRALDPTACAAFLDGKDASAALAKVITPEIVARDRQASAALLAQTAKSPAPPAAAIPMDQLLNLSVEAVSTLQDRDQDVAIAVLKAARDPATPDEGRVMCDFNLALADAILSRPPPVAGQLVRGIWAMR